jgi:hypothetical protein
VVDLVDLDEEGLDDVVPDHLEVGVTDPVRDLERRGNDERAASEIVASTKVQSNGRHTVVLEPVKKLSRTVTS